MLEKIDGPKGYGCNAVSIKRSVFFTTEVSLRNPLPWDNKAQNNGIHAAIETKGICHLKSKTAVPVIPVSSEIYRQ